VLLRVRFASFSFAGVRCVLAGVRLRSLVFVRFLPVQNGTLLALQVLHTHAGSLRQANENM